MATFPAGLPGPRPSARPSARTLGWALGLALATASAAPGAAGGGKPAFDADRPAPRVVLAGADRDTLDFDRRDTFPVAIEKLESDDWQIQRADTASGRIVTRWKPLKHVLARLLMGEVMARCVVDLEPLPDGRTAVTIQGGLASDQDLAHNAGYGAAQAVYRRATQKWIGLVRTALDERARQGLVARVEPARERGPVHDPN